MTSCGTNSNMTLFSTNITLFSTNMTLFSTRMAKYVHAYELEGKNTSILFFALGHSALTTLSTVFCT